MHKLGNTLIISWDTILLLFCGFIVFSPISSIIIMNMLSLPFSFPELLFLPFLFLLRKQFKNLFVINILTFSYLLICICLLLLISLFINNYSFASLLSSVRCYFVLCFVFSIAAHSKGVDLSDLLYISIGTIIGWVFSSFYGITKYLSSDIESIAMTGNILGIPIAIAISLFLRKYKIFIFVLIISILLSFISGMRRQIFVLIGSLIICSFLGSKKTRYTILSYLLLSYSVILIFYDRISDYIQNNIPNLYYRTFYKTQLLFEKNGSQETGDDIRWQNIHSLFVNFDSYFLPSGFASRNFQKDLTGIFIDLPLLELVYMLGFVFCFLLLCKIGIVLWKCYRKYKKTKKPKFAVFTVMILIMFLLLFVEGTFLASSYTVPFTGYCLGQLFYYAKSPNE